MNYRRGEQIKKRKRHWRRAGQIKEEGKKFIYEARKNLRRGELKEE